MEEKKQETKAKKRIFEVAEKQEEYKPKKKKRKWIKINKY